MELVIPSYEHGVEESYPGNISPGVYSHNQIVTLLREHRNNPEAIQFIADMLEE